MIKLIKISTLFILLWAVLAITIPHNIYFHYSRSLFLFDSNFFMDSLSTIGGFANYCAAFITQFFKIGWLGALILSLLLTGIYALTEAVLKVFMKDGKQEYLNLALLPIALQVVLLFSSQYSFVPLFCFALTMLAIYLWSKLKGVVAFCFATLMTLLLYPLTGMWFLIFIFTVIISNRSKLNLVLIPLAAIAPAIYAIIYFNTIGSAYTALVNFQLMVALIYIGVSAAMIKFLPAAHKLIIIPSIICLTIISIVLYNNPREKVMLEIEQAMSERDWQQTLELGRNYPNANILTTYAINTALVNLDLLPQQIFNYPQPFGVEGLFIGRHGSNRKSEYAHYMYASLGLYNEAHRQLWESMTTSGRSISNITGLVLYNRLMGRDKIASKFNAILRKTMFENEFYETIDTTQYAPLFIVNTQEARFTNPQNIMADLSYMVVKADSIPSKRITDCFLVSLLLSNRVVEFGRHTELIRAYYNQSTLPAVYAQALTLLRTKLTPEEFNAFGIEISAEYLTQYNRYAQSYQASRGNMEQMRDFAGTYYYYLNFISPNGPKIITK